MYRNIEDFLSDWRYESNSTISLFKNITNESLNKKDNENVRSIAVLAWHITITIKEMLAKAGLNITGPHEHDQPPNNIQEVISSYENSANSLLENLQKLWTDQTLLEEANMYGEVWKKGITLSILIKHQAHHRGQLTILMRQEGLNVNGVYGPTKEDWAKWNMPAME
jgi:uncharacterized damage-inducible protein DinB